MANDFNKEERVMFEDLCQKFEDGLVLSRLCDVYKISDVTLERASDTIWRPMPYILSSNDGADATANFTDKTQLSVPTTANTRKHVAWALTDTELRDSLQDGRLANAAAQRLASDINASLMDRLADEASIVVTDTAAASGWADIAAFEQAMNRVGVPLFDRYCVLSSATYNGIAADLAGRGTINRIPQDAYQKARISDNLVAGFETYKLDYANRLDNAASETGWLVNGAGQTTTPAGVDLTQSGQMNVDNRTQTLTIDTGAGTIAAGACFTIAGVNEVHHVRKSDTGNSKTFRVISRDSATQITITPAIIVSGDYQNCSAAPADDAAITFINYDDADINCFWHKDSLELVSAGFVIPDNTTVAVMKATTENGIQLVYQKQWDIDLSRYKIRADVRYGTVLKNPEMAGIGLFAQTP